MKIRVGKCGALPSRNDARTIPYKTVMRALAEHPKFRPPSPMFDARPRGERWRMLGNDRYGNCVVGETLVHAPDVVQSYRIPYDGPVVHLTMASGRKLTVTENHAVLTPRGFVLARGIKQGDHAVSAARAEPLGRRLGDIDLDQTPTPIEQVHATLSRRAARSGELTQRRRMSKPIDFHGDGRFMHGDIDAVGPARLLEREGHTSLRQPHGEQEVRSARQLEGLLHRLRTTFQRTRTRWASSFRSMRVGDEGFTFALAHAGVPQRYDVGHLALRDSSFTHQLEETSWPNACFTRQQDVPFPLDVAVKEGRQVRISGLPEVLEGSTPRTQFNASGDQPAADGVGTDLGLVSELLQGFPGSVFTDQVVNVERSWLRGHVYDLSTSSRWYVADGIITHNCTFAGIVRIMLNNARRRGRVLDIRDQDVIDAYLTLTDGKDVGAMPINALTYMRNIGINGYKVLAFARVDTADVLERKSALQTFSSQYVAAGLPLRLDDDRDSRWELTPIGQRTDRDGPRTMGGHAFPLFGYQRGEEFAVPWDHEVVIEDPWASLYMEERWVFIDNQEDDEALLAVMHDQLAAIKAA